MSNLTLEEQFARLASLQPTGDEETDWLYPINPLSIEQGKAFVETMRRLIAEAELEWHDPHITTGGNKETEVEWINWSPNHANLLFWFYGDNPDNEEPNEGFIMSKAINKDYNDFEPTTLLGAYRDFLEAIQ